RLQLFIPKVREDIVADLVARAMPHINRTRERTLQGETDSTIECDPAHETRVQELLTSATDFPYPFIRPSPVLTEPIQQPLHVLPLLIRAGATVFICKVDGVHHLAVNVELQLVVSTIADADGARILVPTQVIK